MMRVDVCRSGRHNVVQGIAHPQPHPAAGSVAGMGQQPLASLGRSYCTDGRIPGNFPRASAAGIAHSKLPD